MKKILLILIVILALFLRFYKLDTYPAINADEASNGYDAYSLLETGRDQHGRAWPLNFQSFNDYKPGLYVYLSMPFVKLLGLNEWSIRIPGAILGVISVLMVYFLVLELFRKQKMAYISAIFLAISPWHIQFSRGGWEVNTSTFFILTGLLFFFKSLASPDFSRKIRQLLLASVFLALSIYSYHAARVLVPLMGLLILAVYYKTIFKNIKPYLVFAVFTSILLIPVGVSLFNPNELSRAQGVGLFADKGPIARINEQRGEHGSLGNPTGRLLHNKGVNYGLKFLANWTSHFNGEFLFMSGDSIERNKVPETGEMYLFDIMLLGAGLIFLAKSFSSESWKFLIGWLIIAPVASALTFQSPNALRSQNMVIPLIVISAFGLTKIIEWIDSRRKNLKTIAYIFILMFVFWNFSRYQEMYWLHMSKEYPYSSQYGLKEMTEFVVANQDSYSDVFITTRYDQPYILYLFYTKYPPEMFQGRHTLTSRDEFGFSTVAEFGKYHFGSVDFSSIKESFPNSLIVGTPKEIPDAANIIKRVYGTNGYEYFDIVSN